jgi:hypothetical protein
MRVMFSGHVLVASWVDNDRLRVLRRWQVLVALRIGWLRGLLDGSVSDDDRSYILHKLCLGNVPHIDGIDNERVFKLHRGAISNIDRVIGLYRMYTWEIFELDRVEQQLVRSLRPRQVRRSNWGIGVRGLRRGPVPDFNGVDLVLTLRRRVLLDIDRIGLKRVRKLRSRPISSDCGINFVQLMRRGNLSGCDGIFVERLRAMFGWQVRVRHRPGLLHRLRRREAQLWGRLNGLQLVSERNVLGKCGIVGVLALRARFEIGRGVERLHGLHCWQLSIRHRRNWVRELLRRHVFGGGGECMLQLCSGPVPTGDRVHRLRCVRGRNVVERSRCFGIGRVRGLLGWFILIDVGLVVLRVRRRNNHLGPRRNELRHMSRRNLCLGDGQLHLFFVCRRYLLDRCGRIDNGARPIE